MFNYPDGAPVDGSSNGYAAIEKTAAFAGTIQLPRTGQTGCYESVWYTGITCAGTGQDGDTLAGATWPSPRFTDNVDQTVTDNLTGLIWTKNAGTPTLGPCAGGRMTWQGAFDNIACLNANNYLNHNDWRLPNVNELESTFASDIILNFTGLSSQDDLRAIFWSSTTAASNTDIAWYVTVSGVVNGWYKSDQDISVWPVRGGQSNSVIWSTGQTVTYATGDDGDLQTGAVWPSPRFLDNSDETVTDNLTGLLWTKDAGGTTVGSCAGGAKTWQAALDYVKCLNTTNYLTHNDWRLPNRRELYSLIDHSAYEPSIQTGHPFTNVQSSYYWSSSTDDGVVSGIDAPGHTDYAWGVSMNDGTVDGVIKTDSYYIWPVRTAQPALLTITVNKAGNGSGNVTGGGTYDYGTSHDITATASAGSTFTGWSGDCTGTTSPLSVLVDKAKTCTATFVSTIPSGTVSINSGAEYTNNTTVSLSLHATDDVAVASYYISSKSTAPGAKTKWLSVGTPVATFDNIVPFKLAGKAGLNTVYVWYKDGSGHTSTIASDTITYDNKPPKDGKVTATPGTGQIQLGWSGFSDTGGSGIASYKVVYAPGKKAPANCSAATDSTADTTFTYTGLTTGSTYSYRVCAMDNAGNISKGAVKNKVVVK